MKSYIIGIAGAKNSGKDTVASMINYIFAIGITKANYRDWITKQPIYDRQHKDRVKHFADPLKETLSKLYNIDLPYFYVRKYKDDFWYCINNKKFVDDNYLLRDSKNSIPIDILDLQEHDLSYYISEYKDKNIYIKLRTLMQYFGTDICRKYLDEDFWIKRAIDEIYEKAKARRLCLVPDVRFANEANSIKFDNDSLYGGLIKINRNNNSKDYHSSETFDFDVNYIINNDGNKMVLFYKVLEICQEIITK